MTAQSIGSNYHLSGDWTITGVMKQVDSLSDSLQHLEKGRYERIHIDCAKIDGIDWSGLQLLRVWLECARIRGVEAELVNLPDSMRHTMRHLGIPVS